MKIDHRQGLCGMAMFTGAVSAIFEPDELSLGEVLDLVDGPPSGAGCVAKPSPLGEAVAEALIESASAERQRLRGVTLADVAAQATAPGGMYYI